MSESISGKEAKLAWANGEKLVVVFDDGSQGYIHDGLKLDIFNDHSVKFRPKPRTITLNGIEVPAPFTTPENLDNSLMWYVLDTDQDRGYSQCRNPKHPSNLLGSWIHEEEIKQVVDALRQVFGG